MDYRTRAFWQEMSKIAFLRVEDVEDNLGTLLPEQALPWAQGKVEDAVDNSFSLRHPWLTGIPTMGIAPAVAHALATQAITRDIQRKALNQLYQPGAFPVAGGPPAAPPAPAPELAPEEA